MDLCCSSDIWKPPSALSLPRADPLRCAQADAMAIWVVQWAGQEIRVLDYIEGQGQVLGYYTNELRHRGYSRSMCYLPHDGVAANSVTGLRFQDHLKDAEFQRGDPQPGRRCCRHARIEAVRRIFP